MLINFIDFILKHFEFSHHSFFHKIKLLLSLQYSKKENDRKWIIGQLTINEEKFFHFVFCIFVIP